VTPDTGTESEALEIRVEGVSRTFGAVQAVHDVSLTIGASEFVTFIGPSGCGKTTLLKMIAGLIPPDAGRIIIGGRSVRGPGPDRALVFQDHALMPWASILRNVAFGLELRGVPRAEREAAARRYIAKVKLTGFEQHYPHQLSGGMQQRAGLARALAVNPRILLMDEPFASVDEQTRRFFQDDLLAVWGEERKTVVFVTHSMEEAVYLSDRVFVISPRPGRLREILAVPLPRPRDENAVRGDPEFTRLVERLWETLRKLQ
jgi:NitT/TauT family transport system ATP-binding protein